MAAVPLFRDTNMAAVTPRENTLLSKYFLMFIFSIIYIYGLKQSPMTKVTYFAFSTAIVCLF